MTLHLIPKLLIISLLTATSTKATSFFGVTCEEKSICYKVPIDVGCFEQGQNTSFCHQLWLPEPITFLNPEFTIRNSIYRLSDQSIDLNRFYESIGNLSVDSSKALWIVVHGFAMDQGLEWVQAMADQLVLTHNCSVLLVNWTVAARAPDYLQAATNARLIGRILSKILLQISRAHKMAVSRMTVVGFSLGAHVAGYAGHETPGLNTIIGLDPAGPGFMGYKPDSRLDETDAQNVIVIHTNGESIIKGGAGTLQPMGDVDIYPNGGAVQSGCDSNIYAVTNIASMNYTALFSSISCSHTRAVHLMLSWLKHGDCAVLFECESDVQWFSGDCWRVKQPRFDRNGCPLRLDDLLRRSTWPNRSRRVCKYRRLFYATPFVTAAHLNYSDPQTFCGLQYQLQIHFGGASFGLLTINVTDSDGNRDLIFNQDTGISSSGLQKFAISTSKVAIPKQLHLSYSPYRTWFGGYGITQCHITSIHLVRIDNQRYSTNGTKVLESDLPTTLELF